VRAFFISDGLVGYGTPHGWCFDEVRSLLDGTGTLWDWGGGIVPRLETRISVLFGTIHTSCFDLVWVWYGGVTSRTETNTMVSRLKYLFLEVGAEPSPKHLPILC